MTRAVVLGGTPAIEVVFLIATAGIAYDRRAEIRSLATTRAALNTDDWHGGRAGGPR